MESRVDITRGIVRRKHAAVHPQHQNSGEKNGERNIARNVTRREIRHKLYSAESVSLRPTATDGFHASNTKFQALSTPSY